MPAIFSTLGGIGNKTAACKNRFPLCSREVRARQRETETGEKIEKEKRNARIEKKERRILLRKNLPGGARATLPPLKFVEIHQAGNRRIIAAYKVIYNNTIIPRSRTADERRRAERRFTFHLSFSSKERRDMEKKDKEKKRRMKTKRKKKLVLQSTGEVDAPAAMPFSRELIHAFDSRPIVTGERVFFTLSGQ